MLTVSDFANFFRELYNGARPYSWQQDVLSELVDSGHWPASIIAPTGAGKSAVSAIHVFARALAIQNDIPVPRRLVLVVGRRALVDSQADQARNIQKALVAEGASEVMREVAALLLREAIGNAEPVGVSVIRGGVTPDRGWIDHPTATQILCMTPDMFGSRLLHRGYGEARAARPRSAGLLAFDSVVVIDESHLNVQLAKTVRRVKEIVGGAPFSSSVVPLQVVETTATPQPSTPDGVVVSATTLNPESGSDRELLKRLHGSKALTVMGLETWPLPRSRAARKVGIETIAQQAIELRSNSRGTIGVIMNRVADAVEVFSHLKSAKYRSVLRVGPMQPLAALQTAVQHPSLLTPDGDPDVDFLVATQTIEVGVDLDLHGMVSEIAPAPSIVQRLGRVNRRGLLSECNVVIVGPAGELADGDVTSPYTVDDIRRSKDWLESIVQMSMDLSPASLSQVVTPAAQQRRLIYEQLSLADAELLSRTSEDVFAEPDLEIWLSEELDSVEQTAGAIGRILPEEVEHALALLKSTPPQEHEVYPTTIAQLRKGFEVATKRASSHGQHSTMAIPIAYIYRDSEWIVWDDQSQRLKPGDVVCFSALVTLVTEGVFLPEVGDSPIGDSLSSWLNDDSLSDRLPWPRQRVLIPSSRGRSSSSQDHIVDSVCYQIERLGTKGEDTSLESIHERMVRAGYGQWFDQLMNGMVGIDNQSVRLEYAPPLPDGRVPWVVLTWESATHLVEESRQEWTTGGRVFLDNHQRDVADRARELARVIGIGAPYSEAIYEAALHHDDGKQHPFFQLRLGNKTSEKPLLAKSGRRKNLSRARTGSDGLPVGWRHEQYSVLLNADIEWANRELVLRLIGTTHGHGRALFDQSTVQLCVGINDERLVSRATELFTTGEWDELIERTDSELNVWGASYLEALLRAADCQISGEGR